MYNVIPRALPMPGLNQSRRMNTPITLQIGFSVLLEFSKQSLFQGSDGNELGRIKLCKI